jgi:tetratricopeptide (TPR) repeat protein
MRTPTIALASFALAALMSSGVAKAQPPAPAATTVSTEAGKLISAGKLDEAVALLRHALQEKPDQPDVLSTLGMALDLQGDYPAARTDLQRAIDLAPEAGKARARIAMAISYAFESKAQDAARFYQPVYDVRLAAGTFGTAGEAANAIARIYLESGAAADALKWYKAGYDAALRQPDITAAQRDLAEMRWYNAQARVAAREGRLEEARQHAAEAKKLFDKGTNPEQAEFMPYLAGYVAYYAKQYDEAIAEFKKANLKDPFILVLLAQALEKKGERAAAQEYYQKILAINSHNIQNAFARPIAKRAVGRAQSN